MHWAEWCVLVPPAPAPILILSLSGLASNMRSHHEKKTWLAQLLLHAVPALYLQGSRQEQCLQTLCRP